MTESENRRIASQVSRSFHGLAWHGPAVVEALDGVDAVTAAQMRPGFHSIWEIVLHVTAWQRMVLHTLDGGEYVSMTGADDWPPAPVNPSDSDWEYAKQEMASVSERLVAAIYNFPSERLQELVPGREFDYYFLLHGIAQHNVYHAGQISLLKRLQ